MNAINSVLSAEGINTISLLRFVLHKMAYGEKGKRKVCPVCADIKNIDDLACDKCIGRYGDDLNLVIHNALCEICPERYPQKRRVLMNFKIVNDLTSKNPETQIEAVTTENNAENHCDQIPESNRERDNLLEIVPGFFLYKDEIEKMADEELRFEANCPICKSAKNGINWMCCNCVKDIKIHTSKIHLIQYAIIGFSSRVDFLDGNLCGRRIEEVLLRVTVKILNSPARNFFLENIPYLVTLLRYFPELEEKKTPIASCIISKVVYHAFAIVKGRPRFQGVVVDNLNKDVAQPTAIAIKTALPDIASEAIIKNVESITSVSAKVLTRESFSREASEILAKISENLKEDSRAGKSLAVFLSQKVLEWKEATGKKNPDTKEFFAKVPFSEKFLDQLKQNGNCSLKFFTELAQYFAMPGEEMLAEGLLILNLTEKENLQNNSLSEADSKNGDSDKIEASATSGALDEKASPKKEPEDNKDGVFLILADSLLEKVKKNLREAPLVARALWAFINEAARKKGMTIIDFGETIDIYASSLCALKIGGNKQQCLSVSKFDKVVAKIGLSKEIIIANGLELLAQGGDTEVKKIFEDLEA